MAIRCENCIHNEVCYMQEEAYDINAQLDEFGCEDYKPIDSKSEAIKEFAERVKEKTLAMVWSPELFSTADYIECIDSLVKEMVGEQ